MSRSLALLLASVLTLPGIPSTAQDSGVKSHREPFTSKMAVETPVERLFPLSSAIPVRKVVAPKIPQSSNAFTNGASASSALRNTASESNASESNASESTPSESNALERDALGYSALANTTSTKNRSTNSVPIANKNVLPGLVTWRKDFATACSLSQRSGKPVLLFQMMGKLDDEFC
jgi:hypothetical protein